MRPDDFSDSEIVYACDVHRAAQIAKAHGYDSIADCAKQLYGWPGASTLTPAEYVVMRWRLARIDELYSDRLAYARSQAQKDSIAAAWERATHIPQRMVGA